MLKEFFDAEQILFFQELNAADLRVINEKKWKRAQESLGSIQSAVIFLIPYNAGQQTTNLSVYAQPRDYHLYGKELFERFARYLDERGEDLGFLGYTDSSPIDERDAALKAGLGVLGKNGLLNHPIYGSFVFIGALLLSRAQKSVSAREIGSCRACGACERACPTGAILDPKREECLSSLTQKKTWTEEEAARMASVPCKWGCDLCQNACPMNRNVAETPIEFFRHDHIPMLSQEVTELDEPAFLARAFSWRGREVLKRNLKE